MKKPLFLKIWLIFIGVWSSISIFAYLDNFFGFTRNVYLSLLLLPPWMSLLYPTLLAGNLIAVYLLWRWKMLGFKLILAILIVISFLNNFYKFGRDNEYFTSYFNKFGDGLDDITFKIIQTVIDVFIGIGILYLAMKPVWKNFK